MILVCSRGHKFDTTDIGHRAEWGDNRLRAGGRCPMLMDYDRLCGCRYCRRVLHELGDGNNKSTISVLPREGNYTG